MSKSTPVKSSGEVMRDAAAKRIAKQVAILQVKKELTGNDIYEDCLAQAIKPEFSPLSGKFLGYRDRDTGKKVTTTLPIMSEVQSKEYTQAEKEALEASLKKEVKPKGKRVRFDTSKTIHLVVKENPRKEGTKVWKSFNLYKEGMSVSDYIKMEGAGRNHLLWDVSCGYVELK